MCLNRTEDRQQKLSSLRFVVISCLIVTPFLTLDARAESGSEHEPEGAAADTTLRDDAGSDPSHGPDVHEDHDETQEGHSESHGNRFFLGIKGVYLAGIHHGEVAHHGGAGIFAEFTLVPHWLELEISFSALSAHGGATMPIDILLKVPFHVNHWFHPYVGLGPAMAIAIEDHHVGVHFGGALAVGSTFWVHSHVALMIEVNYNLLAHDGLLHEVGGGAGVVFGW